MPDSLHFKVSPPWVFSHFVDVVAGVPPAGYWSVSLQVFKTFSTRNKKARWIAPPGFFNILDAGS